MPEDVSDQEILERIRAGDPAGCAQCIEVHAPALYRLALRLMQNEADAEDILQETFMRAFEAIDSFEGRSGLGTWLFRITYNTAMMRLRKPNPPSLYVDTFLEKADEGWVTPRQFHDWCCLPERDFERAEVRAELERGIAQLSPALRAVFVLRELEGLSTEETAAALDVSESVVKTRLHRARLALREHLSAFFVPYVEALA